VVSALDRTRLARVLGMLGSEFAGERAAAAKLADELVRASGSTWPAVLAADEIERLDALIARLVAENTRLKAALIAQAPAKSDAKAKAAELPAKSEAPCTCYQCRARRCLEAASLLRPKERGFCAAMHRQEYPPTEKQAAWLDAICARLGVDP
jgi:hypothetical protein